MSGEEWWGPKTIQAIAGATLGIGVWVGSIQAKINGKADKSKVARNPVEAETVGAGFKGLSEQIERMETNLNTRHEEWNKAFSGLDARQRTLIQDVTTLKAKQH